MSTGDPRDYSFGSLRNGQTYRKYERFSEAMSRVEDRTLTSLTHEGVYLAVTKSMLHGNQYKPFDGPLGVVYGIEIGGAIMLRSISERALCHALGRFYARNNTTLIGDIVSGSDDFVVYLERTFVRHTRLQGSSDLNSTMDNLRVGTYEQLVRDVLNKP